MMKINVLLIIVTLKPTVVPLLTLIVTIITNVLMISVAKENANMLILSVMMIILVLMILAVKNLEIVYTPL